MIEHKTIAGLDYTRITDRADFEPWCLSQGWASTEAFTKETLCDATALLNVWFFAIRHDSRVFIYKRTYKGITVVR